jgi:hypothetical protein
MRYVFTVTLLFALVTSGCSSTGVVPIDRDTYMVAKTSAACGFRSADGTKAKLYREANKFCAKKNRSIETVEVTGRDGIPFARCASAELRFRCVGKDSQR